MTINLEKGQRISLEKAAPGITNLFIGLGWDIAKQGFSLFGGSKKFDLDSSVICLSSEGNLLNKSDVISYRNLTHNSHAIKHQGDNLTGAGKGDDEVINLFLNDIPERISRLVLVVNIYDCKSRKQDFSQVKNAFIRLVNKDNKKEILRYSLSGKNYAGKTAMTLAEIYRHERSWKVGAIGEGSEATSLEEIINYYSSN